jgi:hypothetical protein
MVAFAVFIACKIAIPSIGFALFFYRGGYFGPEFHPPRLLGAFVPTFKGQQHEDY